MKNIYILFIAVWFFVSPSLKAKVNTTDSLALLNLYSTTGGFGWKHKTGWRTKAPLGSWYGVTVQGGRVTGIVLPNNNLTANTLPYTLGRLSNLQVLDLDSNALKGVLPDSLGNLSNLTVLSLNNNKFLDSSNAGLPKCIARLTSLVTLNLGNNYWNFSEFFAFPDWIGK